MFNLPESVKYQNAEKGYIVLYSDSLESIEIFIDINFNAILDPLFDNKGYSIILNEDESKSIGTVYFDTIWEYYYIHILGEYFFKSPEKEPA